MASGHLTARAISRLIEAVRTFSDEVRLQRAIRRRSTVYRPITGRPLSSHVMIRVTAIPAQDPSIQSYWRRLGIRSQLPGNSVICQSNSFVRQQRTALSSLGQEKLPLIGSMDGDPYRQRGHQDRIQFSVKTMLFIKSYYYQLFRRSPLGHTAICRGSESSTSEWWMLQGINNSEYTSPCPAPYYCSYCEKRQEHLNKVWQTCLPPLIIQSFQVITTTPHVTRRIIIRITDSSHHLPSSCFMGTPSSTEEVPSDRPSIRSAAGSYSSVWVAKGKRRNKM